VTYDRPQEWLRALELGANKLQHELLHVILDFRVLHDLSTKGCCHVKSTEPLLGRSMDAEDRIDEPENRQESSLGPVARQREKEGSSSSNRGCVGLIFI